MGRSSRCEHRGNFAFHSRLDQTGRVMAARGPSQFLNDGSSDFSTISRAALGFENGCEKDETAVSRTRRATTTLTNRKKETVCLRQKEAVSNNVTMQACRAHLHRVNCPLAWRPAVQRAADARATCPSSGEHVLSSHLSIRCFTRNPMSSAQLMHPRFGDKSEGR